MKRPLVLPDDDEGARPEGAADGVDVGTDGVAIGTLGADGNTACGIMLGATAPRAKMESELLFGKLLLSLSFGLRRAKNKFPGDVAII